MADWKELNGRAKDKESPSDLRVSRIVSMPRRTMQSLTAPTDARLRLNGWSVAVTCVGCFDIRKRLVCLSDFSRSDEVMDFGTVSFAECEQDHSTKQIFIDRQ